MGINVVTLTRGIHPSTVESYEDAKKCAVLFKANAEKIDDLVTPA